MRWTSTAVLLAPLAAAKQAANFNVTKGFAEAHGCGAECQSNLDKNNPIDWSTFGTDFDFGFYETAANFSTSAPGDLLKIQPMDPDSLDVKAGTTTYRIQYVSRDIDSSPVPATGFIALPYAPPSPANGGNRPSYPLAAYAHGTSGMYRGCAPSTSPNLYDYDSWRVLVERGYAVVAPDYAGLGNNYTAHKYLSFPAQVNDIYYSVVAARKAFKNPGVFTRTWMSVGHSQGGGAVWKLAESDHVKNDSDYLGTVSLAPAAHVVDMFLKDTEGVAASGYLPLHAKALRAVEPSYNLTILGDKLRQRVAIADEAQLCFSALLGLSSDLKGEVVDGEGLKQDTDRFLQWQDRMAPAAGGRASGPILLVQGLGDTAVLPDTTRTIYKRACEDGSEIHLSEYPGLEHSSVIVASAPEWLRWMDARFAGHTQKTGSCSSVVRWPFDLDHVKSPPEA